VTSWGGYVNRLRVGVNMTLNHNPTNADPYVVLSWQTYAQTNYSTYNYDLSASWSGAVSGSATKRASGSNVLMMGSGSFNVTASYDRALNYTINVSASGTGAGPSSHSATGTVPRRPTANPSAPTNPRITVSADRQVRVVWTNATTWPGPASNRHYRGQLSTNASFTNLVSNTLWTNGGVISGLTRGQTYYMRVRSEANWWDATRTSGWSATVSVTVPNVPTLASTPAPTSLTRSGWVIPVATISNNGGQAPSNYRAKLSSTASDTGLIWSGAQGSWAPITISGRAPLTTYYYCVGAYNAAGWGPYTAWRAVTTLDDSPSEPATPTVTDVTETSCTVTWVAPAANGATITGYDLVISDTSNPEVPVVAYRKLGATVLSQAVTGLTKAHDYQAYVRALGNPANSGYSPAGVFRTTGTLATMFPKINDGGTWKDFELWENQAGTWRKVQLQLNVGGVWKWSPE